jgi:hypothetical protein
LTGFQDTRRHTDTGVAIGEKARFYRSTADYLDACAMIRFRLLLRLVLLLPPLIPRRLIRVVRRVAQCVRVCAWRGDHDGHAGSIFPAYLGWCVCFVGALGDDRCTLLPPSGTRSGDQSAWCRPVSHVDESKFIFAPTRPGRKEKPTMGAVFPQSWGCRTRRGSRESQLARRAAHATPVLRMRESSSSFHWHVVPMMNCSHAEIGLGLIHCGNIVFTPSRDAKRFCR